MKIFTAALILALVSMTAMANESKVNETTLLDTSVINAKLEQIVQDRLSSQLSQENLQTLVNMRSTTGDNLLKQTIRSMDFFKVDTSLPE